MNDVEPNSPQPDHLAEEATVWLDRLQRVGLSAKEREALKRWRARSPEHEAAWRGVLAAQLDADRAAAALGMGAWSLTPTNRRRVFKSLGLLVALPVSWGIYRQLGGKGPATYQTEVGRRGEFRLPDGGRILLNTNSAVALAFDSEVRRVILRSGEILVTTAPDPEPDVRPFVVSTTQGDIHALGTKFAVRQDPERVGVCVLEHTVEIQPGNGASPRTLEAGSQCYFSLNSSEEPQPLEAASIAWIRGEIVVDNQRLEDFIAELARYRPGLLHCDPAVADIRLSGAYELADTERVLEIVAEELSLELRYRSNYWITIGPRS